jgi:hypothetical protein
MEWPWFQGLRPGHIPAQCFREARNDLEVEPCKDSGVDPNGTFLNYSLPR